MRVVDIILVIALLTIPTAISKQLTANLKKMMFISVLLSTIFGIMGLALSYQFNLASGATIVMVSGIGFMLSWLYNDKFCARHKICHSNIKMKEKI